MIEERQCSEMEIKKASAQAELKAAAILAGKLWPGHSCAELTEELWEHCRAGGAVFLARAQAQNIGFAQCGLRSDYVEGTSTSPVGYLEGVYVEPAFRRQGVASELLRACEAWAEEQGCSEFASDAEMDNTDSLRFHLGAGFREANRIICFVKDLSGEVGMKEREGP